ncbi:MAG: hypothetical protein LUE08_07160 [Akkermansiaceae bacterium]|nr:hypothetical protein [Akkermansiaceae bacterium]
MAILSALLNSNAQAASYSVKGRQAYNQGLKKRNQAYSEAHAAERQASSVLADAAENMSTARVNQTLAQGSARAQQAVSGMQADTGSGGRLERQVTNVTDREIANMAGTASDKAGSLYSKSYTSKNAGDSALRLGERTQQIYSKLAHASKTAGWIEAGTDATLAAITAIGGYNDAASGEAGEWAEQNPFKYAMGTFMENSDGLDSLNWMQQRWFPLTESTKSGAQSSRRNSL